MLKLMLFFLIVPDLWRVAFRRVGKRHGWQGRVVDHDQLGSVFCLRQRFGNHDRHPVTDVANLVGREYCLNRAVVSASRRSLRKCPAGQGAETFLDYIRTSEHCQHAIGTARIGHVDAYDLRVRMRRANDTEPCRFRQIDVIGEERSCPVRNLRSSRRTTLVPIPVSLMTDPPDQKPLLLRSCIARRAATPPSAPRRTRVVQIGYAVHFRQQAQQLCLLASGQVTEDAALCCGDERRHLVRQRRAVTGKVADAPLALFLALHQATTFQPLDHVAGGGRIERRDIAKLRRVDFRDASEEWSTPRTEWA